MRLTRPIHGLVEGVLGKRERDLAARSAVFRVIHGFFEEPQPKASSSSEPFRRAGDVPSR